jgi:integrase
MASILKRKNKNGTSHWRPVVRIKGFPTVCNHFDRKQEADDWAQEVERQIKMGQFKFERVNTHRTFADLVQRYISDGALEHLRAQRDAVRHMDYWKERLAGYALVHLTPELLSKERQLLIEMPTLKGKKRASATVNRYIAALSSCMTYACRRLRWIDENPCFNLIKLKESKGRDRILSEDEASRLITACRESRNPYLFCIVLLAITTGMRQGEILQLKWDQIDFKNQLAHLKETKNGRPRSVPLVDEVVEELKRLHAIKNPHKSLVFSSKTAFGEIDIKKPWQDALNRAGLINLRFHDIRHSFATLAARQGASNLELATAMGHRTLQMLQRYTHLEADLVRKYSEGITKNLNIGALNEQPA